MTLTRTMGIALSRGSRALTQLIGALVILSLVSCSMNFDMPWDKKAQEIPQKAPTRTEKGPAQQESESSSSSKPSSVEGDFGRKWNKYMTDDQDVRYFCDEEAITKSKNIVQMWRKREFPPGAAQKAIVTLDEIDCSRASIRTLELHVTYADGRTGRSTEATRWVKIYENSSEEYLLGEYCNR